MWSDGSDDFGKHFFGGGSGSRGPGIGRSPGNPPVCCIILPYLPLKEKKYIYIGKSTSCGWGMFQKPSCSTLPLLGSSCPQPLSLPMPPRTLRIHGPEPALVAGPHRLQRHPAAATESSPVSIPTSVTGLIVDGAGRAIPHPLTPDPPRDEPASYGQEERGRQGTPPETPTFRPDDSEPLRVPGNAQSEDLHAGNLVIPRVTSSNNDSSFRYLHILQLRKVQTTPILRKNLGHPPDPENPRPPDLLDPL